MAENTQLRSKLYDNLVSSGKVSANEIGNKEEFIVSLNSRERAAKLYGNISKVLSKEDIGDENQFISVVESEFGQENAQAFTNPLEGKNPLEQYAPKNNVEPTPTGHPLTPIQATDLPVQGSVAMPGQAEGPQEVWQKPEVENIDMEINTLKNVNAGLFQRFDQIDGDINGLHNVANNDAKGETSPTSFFYLLNKSKVSKEDRAFYDQNKPRVEELKHKINTLSIQKDLVKLADNLNKYDADDSAVKHFYDGLVNTGLMKDFASMGITEIGRNFDILAIAKKAAKNDVSITDEEREVLKTYNYLQGVQSQDRGFAHKAGQGFQVMLPFIAQMAITSGVGAPLRAGMAGALKAGLWKETKGLGKAAIAKHVSKKAVEAVAFNAIRSPFTASMHQNLAGKRLEGMEVTAEGTASEKPGANSFGRDLYEAYAQNTLEYLTEEAGGLFEADKLAAFFGNAKMKKLFSGTMANVAKIKGNKGYQAVKNFNDRFQIHGIVGENIEEILNATGSTALTGSEDWNQFTDNPMEMIKLTSLNTLILGSAMGGSQLAASGISSGIDRSIINKNNNRSISALEALVLSAAPEVQQPLQILVEQIKAGEFTGVSNSADDSKVVDALTQVNDILGDNQDMEPLRIAISKAVVSGAKKAGTYLGLETMAEKEIGGVFTHKKAPNSVVVAFDKDNNGFYVLDHLEQENGVSLEIVRPVTGGEAKTVLSTDFVGVETYSKENYIEDFLKAKEALRPQVEAQAEGEAIAEEENAAAIEDTPAAVDPAAVVQGAEFTIGGNKVIVTDIQDDGIYITDQEGNTKVVQIEDLEPLVVNPEESVVSKMETTANEMVSEQPVAEMPGVEQPVARVVPMTKEGEKDYDVMEPDMLIEELSKDFAPEEVPDMVGAVMTALNEERKKVDGKAAKSINEITTKKRKLKEIDQRMSSLRTALTSVQPKEVIAQVPVQGNTDSGAFVPAPSAQLVEKYQKSPKEYGKSKSIILANGEKVSGKWVVTEAGAFSPSHNADGFSQTEGFPTNEDSKTVNDRDYSKDINAQERVLTKSNAYDGRAIDNPIVVSREGVVISGNDRTMAGQLAAKKGTDKAYLEHLHGEAANFGITEDMLKGFKNPRIALEVEGEVTYDTATFAKFNQSDIKTQNRVEKAVKVSKTIDEKTIRKASFFMDKFDTLGEFYADEAAIRGFVGELITDGVLISEQLPELMDGAQLSAIGKDYTETLLTGAVLDEDSIRILNKEGLKAIRNKIAKSVVSLIENRSLGDYAVINRINGGIRLLDVVHNRGFKHVREYVTQPALFGSEEIGSIEAYFAHVLMGKERDFRAAIDGYNGLAKMYASGQPDMFSGKVKTKDEVLNDIENEATGDTKQLFELVRNRNSAIEAQRENGVNADVLLGENQGKPAQDVGNEGVDEGAGPGVVEQMPVSQSGEQGGLEQAENNNQPQDEISLFNEKLTSEPTRGLPREPWMNKPNVISGKFSNSVIKAPVFHGSREQFEEFDESLIGKNDEGVFGKGIYLSENKSTASQYAGADYSKVKAFEVNIQKPFIINFNDEKSVREAKNILSGKQIPEEYDGVIVYESGKMHEVVIRSKSQMSRITIDEDIWNAYDAGKYQQAIKEGILTEEEAKEIVESSGIKYSPIEETGNTILFRDTPYFFSPTEQALNAIKQEKATPEQWKAMLLKNGAKQAEMEWYQFDEFAEGKKSLSRADIQDWIDQNRIEIKEVEKGKELNVKEIGEAQYRFDNLNREADRLVERYPYESRPKDIQQKIDEIGVETNKMHDEYANTYDFVGRKNLIDDTTKYSQYTTPGGENYKELLLTMPEKKSIPSYEEWVKIQKLIAEDPFNNSLNIFNESGKESVEPEIDISKERYDREKRLMREPGSPQFKSSHFDEPNILAHIRFNERTGKNGERVLFIEEIQSDWAQKGKKEGFKGDKKQLPDGWSVKEISNNEWHIIDENGYWQYKGNSESNALNQFNNNEVGNQVPSMPFSKTDQWVNLSLRRMMIHAAENGFDAIAWTSGEMQADRYDLAHHLDSIKYKKNEEGTYGIYAFDKSGGTPIDNDSMTISEVENTLGKDMAQKISNEEGESSGPFKVFWPKDMKVGGEGMKAFYDNIIPAQANKIGKSFGAQTGTIEIPEGEVLYDENRQMSEGDLSPEAQDLTQRIQDEEDGTGGDYTLEEYVSDMAKLGYQVKIDEQTEEVISLKRASKGKFTTVQSIPITDKIREQAAIGMPLFSIIGEKGANALDIADKASARMSALSVARKMESMDKKAKEILLVTGWQRGADKKWRYELPDILNEKLISKQTQGKYEAIFSGEDVYSKELLNAYPEIKDVLVKVAINPANKNRGSYANAVDRSAEGLFDLSPEVNVSAKDIENAKEILIHEIQHYIQDKEGFAEGGSPGSIVREWSAEQEEQFIALTDELNDLKDAAEDYGYMDNIVQAMYAVRTRLDKLNPYEQYTRLSGEVEARNVAKRMNMTAAEKRNSLLKDTEDVSSKDQIFLNKASSKVAAQSQADLKSMAQDLAGQLHTKVEFIENIDELPKESVRKRESKGWYNPKTGKIFIVLPNNKTIADVQATILHEIVGHKGLRGLLGSRFNPTMEKVYESLPEHIRAKFLAKYGNRIEAAEEFMSQIAEQGAEPTIIQQIIGIIRDAFRAMGVNLRMNDTDVLFMLWRSKNRLKSNATVLESIKDQRAVSDTKDKMRSMFNMTPQAAEISRLEAVRKNAINERNRLIKSGDRVGLFGDTKPQANDLFGGAGFDASAINGLVQEQAEIAKVASEKIELLKRNEAAGIAEAKGQLRFGGDALFRDNEDLPIETNNITLTRTEKAVQLFQDRMIAVKKLLDEVKSKGGKVPLSANPYVQETLSSSMGKAELDHFTEKLFNPMMKQIAKIEKQKKVDYAETGRYVKAKHAPEVNRVITTREVITPMIVKMREPQEIKFITNNMDLINEVCYNEYNGVFGEGTKTISGLNNLTFNERLILENIRINAVDAFKEVKGSKNGNVRSGLTDQDAADIVKEYEDKVGTEDVNKLWGMIKAATRSSLDASVKHGLISKETYEHSKKMYEWYVPLRGWAVKEEIDFTDSHSREYLGADILNKVNKKAFGRTSMADDPFPYIANLAESAIISGNKNEIRMNAWRLVVNNQDRTDLFHIVDLWVVNEANPGEDPLWIPTYDPPTQLQIDNGMAVKAKPNTSYNWHKTKKELELLQVPVFVNGQRVVLQFKGKFGELVAGAINGTNVMKQGETAAKVGQVTRWMSANMTSRNPEFMFTNFARDASFGLASYWISGGSGTKLIANVPISFKAVNDDFFNRNQDAEQQAMFNDFKSFGGQTGYVHMKGVEQHRKEIEHMIRQANGAANLGDVLFRNAAMNVGAGILEYLALMSENTMRFAVYKTEIERMTKESGIRPSQATGDMKKLAALRAKEVTTNFNRKGTLSSSVGGLYAFFNASVQGNATVLRLAKAHPAKFTAAVSTMVSMQLVGCILSAMLGGDDDDESEYNKISDYVKFTNFVFPNPFGDGKSHIVIPTPHGFRSLISMAPLAVDMVIGKRTPEEAMAALAKNIAGELSPLNLSGFDLASPQSTAGVLNMLAPTALRPIVEAYATNLNFQGNKIARDNFVSTQDGRVPNYLSAPSGTNKIIVGMARVLNNAVGGTDNVSSGIQYDKETGRVSDPWFGHFFDTYPSKLEHVFEGYLGGRLMFWNNVYKTATSIVEDGEAPISNMPIARRFYKEENKRSGWNTYFEVRNEVLNIDTRLKDFKGARDMNAVRAINNPYNNALMLNLKGCEETIKSHKEQLEWLKPDDPRRDRIEQSLENEINKFAGKVYQIKEYYNNK